MSQLFAHQLLGTLGSSFEIFQEAQGDLICVGVMGCLMGKEDMMGAASQPGPRPYQQNYGGYGYQPYGEYPARHPLCQNDMGYQQQPYGTTYQPMTPLAYGDTPGYGYQGPQPGYGYTPGYNPGPGYAPGYTPGYPEYPPTPYQAPNGEGQGMSNGGKMAVAAAGGLALGAGAALAVDHAGDIAHFAEEAVEDVGEFARDLFWAVQIIATV